MMGSIAACVNGSDGKGLGAGERADAFLGIETQLPSESPARGRLADLSSVASARESTPDGGAGGGSDEAMQEPSGPLARVVQREPETLPGREARDVLHEEVDEAENIFFTEEGRLFVSGGEDIYEFVRREDGTFVKLDYFHEDCIVEGIVGSGDYLYGVCWKLYDLSGRSFFIAGEITDSPTFRIVAELQAGTIPNGMTVDPEGRIYVTYTAANQIMRFTLASPLELGAVELWADDLPSVNGIKYRDGYLYATYLSRTLSGEFVRLPLRPDGSAGPRERLLQRPLAVLDDILPFEEGFIITDFLKGTLMFWDPARGLYAETPTRTFYGPTSLARGVPPLFDESQLIVPEKGNFLIRGERRGDLLSVYQLPQ